MNNFSIVSNCPLCEEHSLHVSGENETETMQCINCGYATANKFKGLKDDTNDAYKTLTDEMKNWCKYANGRIWVPSIITLPFGMLYPVDIDNNVTHQTEMKWAWAEMVNIEEHEKEKYSIPGTDNFYEQRIDTDNRALLTSFLEGMVYVNQKAKEINEQSESVGLKLPKLKKK